MEFQSCLICLEPCCPLKQGQLLKDKEFPVIHENLNVIFVLKTVLNIPKEVIEKYVKAHGSPTEWGIVVCSTCKLQYLERAKVLHTGLQTLRKEVQGRVQHSTINEELKISSGVVDQVAPPAKITKGKGRGTKRKKLDQQQQGPVFQQVRKWVVDNVDEGTDTPIKALIEAAGSIENYVAQLQIEKTFKTLGPGRKLTDDSQPGPSSAISMSNRVEITASSNSSSQPQPTPTVTAAAVTNCNQHVTNGVGVDNMKTTSEEKMAAANAALARFEKAKKPDVDSKELLASRQAAFIKEEARKQLDAEANPVSDGDPGLGSSTNGMNNNNESHPLEIQKRVIDPASYIVQGVFYRCPEAGVQTPMPKKEVERKIREYLTRQIKNDDCDAYRLACRIIHSCNSFEKISPCINLLWQYLDNIIQNPTVPKYHQIRCANKSFKEKVRPVFGGELFLETAAFRKELLPNMNTWNQEEEECWLFTPADDTGCGAELITLRDMLKTTLPLKPHLDRNVQVLHANQMSSKTELPDEFFKLTKDEIKREQESRTEVAERELTLRTKAMRDREGITEHRIYHFGVIRVRFPDSTVLQGTFSASETLSSLFSFVRENLIQFDLTFTLLRPAEGVLNPLDKDKTLSELKLVPSSIINFQMENTPPAILSGELAYLNPALLSDIIQ